MFRMAPSNLRDGPRPKTVSRRTESLVASVTQHHRAISAHQSQLLTAIVELDRRRAWRVDGATSMVAWLVQRCGVNAATAREWVTAAAKLPALPKIADALSQGRLSFDQVKPLVEVAKPETDATLAEQATHWSAKQVRELAIAARNQSDERSTGFYARRFLRFDDRRRSLAGVLPADQYAVVKSSLVARASRRRGDRTPFDQRMADALVAVCHGDGAARSSGPATEARAGGPRRNRPTVVVHADMSFLVGGAGGAELDVLGPVSREVARRLACDAKVLVSADGPGGRASTWEGPDAIPPMRSGSRSGAATRDAASPAARTPNSPTCTTSCTGPSRAPPMSPTWSSSVTSITAASTRWDGRCPGTPASSSPSGVPPGGSPRPPPHRRSRQRETDRLVDRVVKSDVLRPLRHPHPDQRGCRRGQCRLQLGQLRHGRAP